MNAIRPALVLVLAVALVFTTSAFTTASADSPSVDPTTGLPIADGFETVRLHCSGCHSARLVAQNRATREGWLELIRWMQRTQRLPDLAEDEAIVLDYLATHLGPAKDRPRRRAPLPVELLPPD